MKRRRTRGKGEGSIWKRQDGRWAAQIDLGWSDKRNRKTFYGESRSEVAQKLNDAIAAVQKGAPIATGRRTVNDHMTFWLDSIRPPIVRDRTFQNYEGLYRNHIKPALGAIQIGKLRHEMVQAFLNQKTRSGLSTTTVKHIRGVLRQALGAAIKGNLISVNSAGLTKLPKTERSEINPLTEDQTRALLAGAVGTRLDALLVVALRLGLRRGEILGLQWPDAHLDGDEPHIEIRRAIQRIKGQPLTPVSLKTPESRRDVPIPPEVARALRAHQITQAKTRLRAGAAWHDQQLVFANTIGRPFEPRAVDSLFKRLLKKAGLPTTTRFHDCRHTAFTSLLGAGAELYQVSRLAGHSSVSITADVYGHWSREGKRGLVEKMTSISQA